MRGMGWINQHYLFEPRYLDRHLHNDTKDATSTTYAREKLIVCLNELSLGVNKPGTQNLVSSKAHLRREGTIASKCRPASVTHASNGADCRD